MRRAADKEDENIFPYILNAVKARQRLARYQAYYVMFGVSINHHLFTKEKIFRV
ncbi:hypothetical protein [Vulcanisaeta sp. JCM 16161]|uniref:hypothetical protein n=1 Tax=Vulcanisaeta sp. JCM 16161 TaxID=1295372 RepID=UPI000A522E4A|nr:hypothetical protein [Vulcanisaeta sp. JCM 16161]